MTQQLSPAAQAVLNAAYSELDYVPQQHLRWCVAAALRAAADQVVVKLAGLGQESAWHLEKIATELDEAQ